MPITPKGSFRYGSKAYSERLGRIICIRENHCAHYEAHPTSELVALDAEKGGEPLILLADTDFHSSPCIGPEGRLLARLNWDYPDVPWDGTELLVADLDDRGLIGEPTRVAGGIDEAIIQPEWSPTGQLFVISDRTGWPNLYCGNDGEVEAVLEESVLEMEAEFARSNWWVGMCSYAFDSPDSRVYTYSRRGYWRLAQLCQAERRLKPTSNPDYGAPEGAKPPLVMMCHGVLHSAAGAELNLTTQYWTSRGVAVLDVNYGGSTGFGREYRERLIREWGVVDVNDRVNAALYLVGREDVDGQQMANSGGRAGGFTAPAALTFRDVFKAGQVISE